MFHSVALATAIIDGYRSGTLLAGEVAALLGLDTSIAAQGWLAKRSTPLNYSVEDLEADRATL